MCCEGPVTNVFIALPALIGGQLTGRNSAYPPPAPMRPLCSVRNVWVTRMCCQVMYMRSGEHVYTA